MTDSIRILLCEDQTLMRQGLHTILELEPGFQVVGEAADGEEAVSQYNTLRTRATVLILCSWIFKCRV